MCKNKLIDIATELQQVLVAVKTRRISVATVKIIWTAKLWGVIISVGEASTIRLDCSLRLALPSITRLGIKVREQLALACAHASLREVWREMHACA